MRRKIFISRKSCVTVASFVSIFVVSLTLSLLYHTKVSGFMRAISPLGNSPAFTQELQNELNKQGIQNDGIVPQQDGSLMTKLTQSNTTIYFSPDKSPSSQVSSLQEVVAQLTIDGKRAYRIDFRFNVPIVSSESL